MLRPPPFLRTLLAVVLLCIVYFQFIPSFVPRIPSLRAKKPSVENEWPNKIWQTWQTPAALLDDRERERVQSWHDLNPGYRYELLSDTSAEEFVRQHFDEEPLIRDVFFNVTDKILRADFLRYLVLLAEGGVYTDIDTTCLQPIWTWAPFSPEFPRGSFNAIVGIESDRPSVENDWKIYADKSPYIFRLENWTISSRRGHSFLRHVVDAVIKNLLALAREQGKELGGIEVQYNDVIDTTGPRAFTKAFFDWASKITGREWTYKDLTMLEEPKLVGDVIVLPIRAMSALDANRKGDGAHSPDVPSLIRHWSVGSWKAGHTQAGGEKHPEGQGDKQEDNGEER